MWTGHAKGVVRVRNKAQWELLAEEKSSSSAVKVIVFDRKGLAWVGDEGGRIKVNMSHTCLVCACFAPTVLGIIWSPPSSVVYTHGYVSGSMYSRLSHAVHKLCASYICLSLCLGTRLCCFDCLMPSCPSPIHHTCRSCALCGARRPANWRWLPRCSTASPLAWAQLLATLRMPTPPAQQLAATWRQRQPHQAAASLASTRWQQPTAACLQAAQSQAAARLCL